MALTSLSKITNRARGQNCFAFHPLYGRSKGILNIIKISFLGYSIIYMWKQIILGICQLYVNTLFA